MTEHKTHILNRSDYTRLDLSEAITITNPDEMNDAADYMEGLDGKDVDLLKEFLKGRYAVGIRRIEDETDSSGPILSTGGRASSGYEDYTKGAVSYAIENIYNVCLTHVYKRIASTLGCLFSQPHAFEYVAEGLGGDQMIVPEVQEAIEDYREYGRAQRQFIRADRLSVACGAAALRIGWRVDCLFYEAIRPSHIWAAFGDRVESDGQTRATITHDIEDASLVVLKLASGNGRDKFIAYVGRCEAFPAGRMVTYWAKEWRNIPYVNSGSVDIIEEYTVDEQPANPLTWLQNQRPDICRYEYPISIFLGCDAGVDVLLPNTGMSLYRLCREIDAFQTRVMFDSLISSHGTYILKNERGAPAPASLYGAVMLRPGQELSIIGQDASQPQTANTVLNELQRALAEAYGIPGHLVVSDETGAPESGYALAIRYKPLIDARRERVQLNEDAILKIYDIERGLIAAHTGQYDAIGANVEQRFVMDDLDLPKNPVEEMAELQARKDLGVIDIVGIVMEVEDMNEADAIEYLKQIKERSAEFEQPKSTGNAAIDRIAQFRAQRLKTEGKPEEKGNEPKAVISNL